MKIGGLQKNSFIDFPGKVSCVFFLAGCNFDCPYCHNPDLVDGSCPCNASSEEAAFEFLDHRRGLLEGVVLSGGEPTLQEDLPLVCEKVKSMGYPIKLDTNGSRPKVLKHLMDDGLIDFVSMDLKTDPLLYSPLITRDIRPQQILTSIRLIMESNLPYEFRTTCVKPIVDEAVVDNIAKTIHGADMYVLQRFRCAKVLHPEFFEGRDASYTDQELEHLRSLAAPWVRQCIVR
jgi:pyruvate formate lyase activating enzyme